MSLMGYECGNEPYFILNYTLGWRRYGLSKRPDSQTERHGVTPQNPLQYRCQNFKSGTRLNLRVPQGSGHIDHLRQLLNKDSSQ
jgi:hypothetical protein